MPVLHLQNSLERLASVLRSDLRMALLEHGLQPVQFEALSYLANCNRYSDTAKAVSEFLGQTKGTVSQTLNVLEREGLISKLPDETDKRINHLKPTAKGKAVLQSLLPSNVLQKGAKQLSSKQQADIEKGLSDLLLALQAGNGFMSFGVCKTCIHHQTNAQGSLCKLTQETLSKSDSKLICREHSWA